MLLGHSLANRTVIPVGPELLDLLCLPETEGVIGKFSCRRSAAEGRHVIFPLLLKEVVGGRVRVMDP